MSFRGWSTVFTGALFLVVAWALWEASGWELQANLMAWLIGLPTAALLAVHLLQQLAARADPAAAAEGAKEEGLDAALAGGAAEAVEPAEERRRTARIIAWILGFAVAIWLVGFQFGVGLMTLLYLKGAGERWPAVAGITLAVLAAVVLVFDCGMHIFFAEGKLFVWSGWSASPFFTSVCYQVASPFRG